MKTLARIGAFASFVFACAFLAGCGGGGGSSLPTMSAGGSEVGNDLIRVGDKITIQLTGVPDQGYFIEKQVPPSGDVNVNLLTQSFHAAGKTPGQLGQEITDAYKSQKIYTNPVVTVLEEERYVTVGGDVRNPTSVVYRADLTLIGAINGCGGFTEFADRHHVRVIRGSQVFHIDCIKAAATPGADPAVYPGDRIYVPRTAF